MPMPFFAETCRASVEADDGLDLFQHLIDAGDGQVDLVDDRDNLQAGFDGRVGIGDRLCLHPLEGIDEEQGSFTRRQ